MGIFSDTYDEFKKASPQEKVVIVGASVAALGIALYLHNKNKAATSGPDTGAASFQSGTGGGGGGGTTTGTAAPIAPVAPVAPVKPGTPAKPPTKAPVAKQPTTVTKTYASTPSKPSAPKATPKMVAKTAPVVKKTVILGHAYTPKQVVSINKGVPVPVYNTGRRVY